MSEGTDVAPGAGRPLRRMRVDRDRVFYCGDLGEPAMRRSGALSLLVALDAPIRYRFDDGGWNSARALLIEPHVRHQLSCATRKVAVYMIKPETVELRRLPTAWRRGSGPLDAPQFVRRMLAAAKGEALPPDALDLAFFDVPLPARALDPRIARIIRRLQDHPNCPEDGDAFAAEAGLSVSRLLHLFKAETGCSYRSLRAWKRARQLLPSINQSHNLAQLALDIGYPDSTHFSHSIRTYFGIAPKDILRGCRRIRIIDPFGRDLPRAGAAAA